MFKRGLGVAWESTNRSYTVFPSFSYLESKTFPKEATSESFDDTNGARNDSNNESERRPGRQAAETAKQSLHGFVGDGAFESLDAKDADYMETQGLEPSNGENEADKYKENANENGSHETTSSDSGKEILVCKFKDLCFKTTTYTEN